MAKPESNFDKYIYKLLDEAGIDFDTQGSIIKEVDEALKTASKNGKGNAGYPEVVAKVGEFLLVMEDKADRDKQIMLDDSGEIQMVAEATVNYAVNGAIHYAHHIIKNSSFKKIFAFGNSGDSKHHILQPYFVGESGVKLLPEVETFENFSEDNIDDYYKLEVLEIKPAEEEKAEDILAKAKELHEALRNYGGLGEDEKPLVVSAILLALQENSFSVKQLQGKKGEETNVDDEDYGKTDGELLYNAIETHFGRIRVSPDVKKERVLAQFNLLKMRPLLNEVDDRLGKTPLKYFTEYIDKNIHKAVVSNSAEDYLGRFYGEFVSYSGGDGQALGVVLTPRHITELFTELVHLKSTDTIFDPCCGTGGFLVSAMHKMLSEAKTEAEKKQIKEKQIHGIEIRDDMFAIATTNMILRGDGRSNIECKDFLKQDTNELQAKGLSVGLMNPPYSQAKSKETASLSELSFIRHLLDSLTVGGRVAVIVPVSAMIGKTKEDKAIKKEILKNHTLEGVISLSKETFYGVGTVPCIAVFTTGEKHPVNKKVKFINFEDDGFKVNKHIGLVKTERAKDRKQLLLDCWNDRRTDYPSKFMVETTVEDTDEWLHSFYYYNDEIPSEEDFRNSIADYLTFEFNMITHGRGYLFEAESENSQVVDKDLRSKSSEVEDD
ncbi:MAG: SAM-dependent methyltransferase [Streptococcaceae bacterium]|jgi:type I restriction-modification system DNA methylase subunit|nr:SAM-dependent methyltransferase [Streptococcaceae bacterium]